MTQLYLRYRLGARPPFGSMCPRVKRPLREADHSSPSTANLKNTWSFTPLLHTPSKSGLHFTSTVYVLIHQVVFHSKEPGSTGGRWPELILVLFNDHIQLSRLYSLLMRRMVQ